MIRNKFRIIKKGSEIADKTEGEEQANNQDENEEDTSSPPLETFDMEAKIDKWEYVLDRESRAFKKPVIPSLSDAAIKPFQNAAIKSSKLTIYDCPFCKRVFTYPLPFKSHLYSCEENKNMPDYVLLCAKHPDCLFQSRKRLEMIAHFRKAHTLNSSRTGENDAGVDEVADETNVAAGDATTPASEERLNLSEIKKNQLKVNQYYYLDREEFKYTYCVFNEIYGKKYRNLKAIDQYYEFSSQVRLFIVFKEQ